LSRASGPPAKADRFTLRLLYLCGVMQGLALVTFPAASAIFASPTDFHLSSAQYGAMFIPQVTLAIIASAIAPRLARRFGMRAVLLLGIGANLLSMTLLAVSPLLIGAPAAFALLCCATGALGFGFGATVMTLNALVERLAADRADAAVLTLNALLGVGTALAPALVALFTGLSIWWALPALAAVFAGALFVAFATSKQTFGTAATPAAGAGLPRRVWLYAAAALLYGIVETLSGNWATLYLSAERSVPAREASYALTAFWLLVTLGRVGLAASSRWIRPQWAYVALPLALAVVFQLIAHADGALWGIFAFGAAGLACSGFLPLSISLGGAEFPSQAATVAGLLIAIYQVGYGIAAFGVGPLRDIVGLDYSTVFALGGVVAVGLAAIAFLVASRHRSTAS